MNATLCPMTDDIELDTCDYEVTTDSLYSTMPMDAIRAERPALDEEALYSSFEEALSDRVVTFQNLKLNIHTTDHNEPVAFMYTHRNRQTPQTEPLVDTKAASPTNNRLQQLIMYICLSLILMMLGFDMMGLLIMMRIH